jgi:DNA-binding NarL/FixJ family response regulator
LGAASPACVRLAGTDMSIRVQIVDDQNLVRSGLRLLLEGQAGIDVVGEAGDGAAAVAEARRSRPDVILMDIQMPGVDGIEATSRLRADAPERAPRIIMLTTFDSDDHVVQALRAGASGFLLKDVDPEALVDAINVVAAGGAVLGPSVTRHLLDRFADRLTTSANEPSAHISGLSERELVVLRLLARGLSNREMADALVLTEPTIKSHISHILLKLDLRDRTQAVIAAYEAGVVRPGAILAT